MNERLIQDTYARLPTDELLVVISNQSGYTIRAKQMAMEELRRRQVSDGQIEAFKRDCSSFEQLTGMRNITDDLNIPQKIFFYFLWLPRFSGWMRLKLSREGLILKVWQSNYYSFTGFIGFLLAVATASSSAGGVFVVWTAILILAFAFDRMYNLNRQRRKLRRLESAGQLDFAW